MDENIFKENNTHAYESLKKIRQSRLDTHKVKEVTERAFQFVENRDKHGLIKLLEECPQIPIVDLVDQRGYTLLHMVCFKNLEEMGL